MTEKVAYFPLMLLIDSSLRKKPGIKIPVNDANPSSLKNDVLNSSIFSHATKN